MYQLLLCLNVIIITDSESMKQKILRKRERWVDVHLTRTPTRCDNCIYYIVVIHMPWHCEHLLSISKISFDEIIIIEPAIRLVLIYSDIKMKIETILFHFFPCVLLEKIELHVHKRIKHRSRARRLIIQTAPSYDAHFNLNVSGKKMRLNKNSLYSLLWIGYVWCGCR